MNLIRKNLKNRSLYKAEDILITYWVYPEYQSPISKGILKCLDIPNYHEKNIFELYLAIFKNIQQYRRKCLQETTIYFFLAKFLKINESDIEGIIDTIQDNCIGEKYKPPKSKNTKDIYARQQDRNTLLKHQYDYEDLWHIFQTIPHIQQYLELHKINNMFQLVEMIKNKKYSEYMDKHYEYFNTDKPSNSYINEILFWDEEFGDEFSDVSTSEFDMNDFGSEDYTKLIDRYEEDDE
jgi:hypothetical protein